MTLRHFAAPLMLALPLLSGCHGDEPLNPPASSTENNGLFLRYVSIGNSIAAGVQSAGINDSTQQRTFPVLFARQVHTPFAYPRLAGRGCPAPYTNNVTQTRVGNQPPSQPCDLRTLPAPDYINNLAVPGLGVRDAFSNTASGLSTFSQLTTFLLGGRTQLQALLADRPTFVSVEIGSNDILGGLLADDNVGNIDSITPPAVFAAKYTELMDSVAGTGAKAVLFGIPDITVIPYASTGATYWCLKTGACPGVPAAAFPPTFTVSNNCAPAAAIPGAKGDSTLVPWPIGLAKIKSALAGPVTLDCSADAEVVTPAEYAAARNATDADNAVIQQQAQAHGWAFVDANQLESGLRSTGGIPAFPDISGALAGQSVLFGPYITLDGLHPSTQLQRIIADSMISAVNRTYGTGMSFVGP